MPRAGVYFAPWAYTPMPQWPNGGGGFRVGGGVHDSYTFQCGLVDYFTSPGIVIDMQINKKFKLTFFVTTFIASDRECKYNLYAV